jgi:transcriptional regulator with XRE-family HTH domain
MSLNRRVAHAGQPMRGPDKLETDTILETFGQTLKSARKTAGLTQQSLAHRCFLRPPQVSRYERGVAEPHLTVLLSLAHALDSTASQLLDGLVLAPTRQASQAAMHALIGADAGVSTKCLADALLLPEWYVDQNARCMQSLGMIHQGPKGWVAGTRGGVTPSSVDA